MMEVESDIFGSAEPMLDDGAMDESENVDHVENSQVMLHSQLSTVEQAIMDDIFASDDEEEDNYKQKVSSVPVDEADFDDDMRELMNNPNSNPAADQYSDIDDHSTSSESDQEVDAVVEGRKQASKMEKVAAKPRKTAVEMEIEAVKLLEKGPSEAELRRRKLIEMDPDELEEKIEHLNRIGLEQVSKATGLSQADRRDKLIKSRVFLGELWKAKKHTEEIETYCEKQLNRLYGENDPPFDVYHYLEKETYEDDEFIVNEEKKEVKEEVEKEENVIYLSDSDDDSELGETDHDRSPAPIAPAPPSPPPTITVAKRQPQLLFKGAVRVAPNSRAALLINLRQKVLLTATENYCTQRKIKTEELQFHLDLSEHCRQLIEMLRDHHSELAVTTRIERKKRYELLADADEEEFDDGYEGLGEGKYVSEEEKQRILRQFASENDSSDSDEEEDEEEDDEGNENGLEEDAMDEEEVEEEVKAEEGEEEVLQEELDANNAAVTEPQQPSSSSSPVAVDQQEGGEEEEEDSVQMGNNNNNNKKKKKKKAKSSTLKVGYDSDNEDNDDHDSSFSSHLPTSTSPSLISAPAPALRVAGMSAVGLSLADRNASLPLSSSPSLPSSLPPPPATSTASAAAVAAAAAAGGGRLVKKQYGRRQHSQPSIMTALSLEREATDDTQVDVEMQVDETLVDTFQDSDADADEPQEEDEAKDEARDETQLDTQIDSLDTDLDPETDLQSPSKQPKKAKKPKKINTGNTLYRMQLEEEERRLRNRQKSIFHDDEAEEEEEQGRQSGLGDFGFGMSSSKHRELEEEKDALRLRKGDLDHIVDDISDDEGDEIAGAKARQLQELQEDREQMKMVITAVTEGHENAMQQAKKMKKGGYSFEALVSGKTQNQGKNPDSEAQEEEVDVDFDDELDVEAMLQRGFAAKLEREKRRKYDDTYFSDDDDDLHNDDDEALDEEQQRLLATMTEEQRLQELEAMQRRREEEKQQMLRRKQMDKDFKMRRELRQQQQRELLLQRMQPSNKAVIGFGAASSHAHLLMRRQSSNTSDELGNGNGNSRSISSRPISPRPFPSTASGGQNSALKDVSNLLPPSMHRSTSLTGNPASNAASKGLHRTKTTTAAGKGSKYSGELSRSEVENGYGMGMASSLPAMTTSKSGSFGSKGGLFSMVTGQAASASTAAITTANGAMKKRSFSAMLHTAATTAGQAGGAAGNNSGGGMMKKRITPVSLGQQFVFMDTSSMMGGGDTTGGASRSHMPIDTITNTNTMARSSSMSAAAAGAGDEGMGESLFAKLGARSGGNNNSNSLKRSFTTINKRN